MKREVIIHFKKGKIKVIAKNCNVLQKLVGLMFSRREKAGILLFDFRKKQKIRIHSWYVFFPFVAVWLDEKNRVVDLKIVKPFAFCVSHRNEADKLIEIPINNNHREIAAFFRRKLETFK